MCNRNIKSSIRGVPFEPLTVKVSIPKETRQLICNAHRLASVCLTTLTWVVVTKSLVKSFQKYPWRSFSTCKLTSSRPAKLLQLTLSLYPSGKSRDRNN